MKWKDSFHPYAIITIVCWSLAYVFTSWHAVFFAVSVWFYCGISSPQRGSCGSAGNADEAAERGKHLWLPWRVLWVFSYMLSFNKGNQTVTSSTARGYRNARSSRAARAVCLQRAAYDAPIYRHYGLFWRRRGADRSARRIFRQRGADVSDGGLRVPEHL